MNTYLGPTQQSNLPDEADWKLARREDLKGLNAYRVMAPLNYVVWIYSGYM